MIRKNKIIKDCEDVRDEYRKAQRYAISDNDENLLTIDKIENLARSNRHKEAKSLFHEFAMRHPQYKVCRKYWEQKARETQIQRIKDAISIKFGTTNGDNNSNK